MDWLAKLGIKHLRGIYNRDGLPHKIRKECGIINLDDMEGAGTHWFCYRNLDSMVEYFDPFGLIMPNEARAYFHTSGKHIFYSMGEIQNRSTVLCGYWCLYYLLERQQSSDILDKIHNPHFDSDNSDFIKAYIVRCNNYYKSIYYKIIIYKYICFLFNTFVVLISISIV